MSPPADDAWAEGAGVRIAEALSRALEGRDQVSLALAGGSTPAPVYRWLAEAGGVPWERVQVYFGDERRVPPDHEESNYRMARETLLEPAAVPDSCVYRMHGESHDPEGAAEAYAALLPPRIDVLLLGIGNDGHTASLFPGAPALRETDRRVVAAQGPAHGPDRLTITPPVLEAAQRIFVLARGPSKAEAVARALEGEWAPERCPAQLARHGTWLLDSEAASRLRQGRAPDGS